MALKQHEKSFLRSVLSRALKNLAEAAAAAAMLLIFSRIAAAKEREGGRRRLRRSCQNHKYLFQIQQRQRRRHHMTIHTRSHSSQAGRVSVAKTACLTHCVFVLQCSPSNCAVSNY